MKQLIGLTGYKRSGKDTACLMLAEIVKPLVLQRIGFADALKQEVSDATKLPVWYINENKDNFRLILQGWGTDYRRKICGDDYWLDRWQDTYDISEADVIVVPDVRFINEAQHVKKMGGVIWRIKRPLSEIDFHVSETELKDIPFTTINNNSSPAHMMQQLQKQYAIYTTTHAIA